MKIPTLSTVVVALATLVAAQGSGRFAPADYITHSSLPRHTIYRPNNHAAAGAMPVLVWSNGACSADGTSVQGFLKEIASHGYLVISQGRPGQSGQSNVEWMRESVTWAANGANGLFNVNRGKIMAAGYSCGGAETWGFITDNRVATIGILNSGGTNLANTIRKPMIVMLGGPSDVAYPNGESDYSNLPSGTPSWKGNINSVGHGGTYYHTNGGLYAKAMVKWLDFVLKGDANARSYFQGNTAVSDGWTNAVSKNLNSIAVGGGHLQPRREPRLQLLNRQQLLQGMVEIALLNGDNAVGMVGRVLNAALWVLASIVTTGTLSVCNWFCSSKSRRGDDLRRRVGGLSGSTRDSCKKEEE